ncbi:CcmD family protein [Paenibacillus sp. Dod16]
MYYLFAAYSVVWLLIGGYLFVLGNRQAKLSKELKFLQDMQKKG